MQIVRMALVMAGMGIAAMNTGFADRFEGTYYRGEGDSEYLQLLDTAYRMFYPDAEYQNISMLYSPAWNGFVEGPTWGAWWIQNSYGPTYCALPFFLEPYTTFMQDAQDLWFSQMGDGQRKGMKDWVAPDGCLCDAAAPSFIYYKQGDGRTDIHDWGMEFTAAGIVMQAEALLIGRNAEAIAHYLPLLERSANFIETRRDPQNNLFLAGAAGNLLAPSYAGWQKPDGTFDNAYLAGLSITYIAALDRLIELEDMAGHTGQSALYGDRRDRAKKGLPHLMTEEGYFVKSIDPDGTKHGVYGAAKHGYFEAVCNHDAMAFRVVNDDQARTIYEKIQSIPGLRPHDVIITNYPGLDDTYTSTKDWLWSFGTWVNGGHWTTCEARMILGYYRVGAYEDARRSMKHILEFARIFRMDNNLTDFGAKVYQPKQPINCVYDTWGAPAALIRGLFEYLYTAKGLTLVPHIPGGIERLEQRFPIRFGTGRLYLSTRGHGPVTGAWLNGEPLKHFDAASVFLPEAGMPAEAHVLIGLGGALPDTFPTDRIPPPPPAPDASDPFWNLDDFAGDACGNTLPLRIGADSNGQHAFQGDMQRVRLFRRALAPEEAAALENDAAKAQKDEALVADYRLASQEDGNIGNNAGDAMNARVSGTVTTVKPAKPEAARFTGNGFIEVAHDARLMPAKAYTIEAWICPAAFPEGGMRVADKVLAGVDNGYLLDVFPANGLRFITEQGSLAAAVTLRANVWAHIVAVCDADRGLALYLDGQKVAEGPVKRRQTGVAFARAGAFYNRLAEADLADTYEARHAHLIVDYVTAMHARAALRAKGLLPALPETSQQAADHSYIEAADRLASGLETRITSYEHTNDPAKQRMFSLWNTAAAH